MKKFQALLLALVVATPIAISATAAQASTAKPHRKHHHHKSHHTQVQKQTNMR